MLQDADDMRSELESTEIARRNLHRLYDLSRRDHVMKERGTGRALPGGQRIPVQRSKDIAVVEEDSRRTISKRSCIKTQVV